MLNILYKHTNYYRNSLLTTPPLDREIPSTLNFAVFGSTYAQYAFGALKDMGADKAFNFALPCESSEADFVKLKYFSNRFSDDCVVAITLAPCNTLYNWGQLSEGQKHYAFMSKKEKKDWNLFSFIKYYVPIFPFDIRRIARILLDIPKMTDIYDINNSIISDKEVEDGAKKMAENWKRLFKLDDLQKPISRIENVEMVKKNTAHIIAMMEFCQVNHYRPIIVIPPFIDKLNNHLSIEFVETTLGAVFKSAKERNIPVYNYREKEEFQHNKWLYLDGFFCLNRYGSELFIKDLFSAMKKDGIIMNNGILRS